MNISNQERVVSSVAGACMVAAGLIHRGWTGLLLGALGAAFVGRGWTGRCPLNEKLKIDRRHAKGNRGQEEFEDAISTH